MTKKPASVHQLPTPYRVAKGKPVRAWTAADVQSKVMGNPFGPDADLLEVTRLMGDSAANGDKHDPVVFNAPTEVVLRRLITRYGFDRLPETYGELNGFLDYALFLEGALADDIAQYPEQAAAWVRAALEVCEQTFPQYLVAMKLFVAKDAAALLAHHTAEKRLLVLGQTYREFEDDLL